MKFVIYSIPLILAAACHPAGRGFVLNWETPSSSFEEQQNRERAVRLIAQSLDDEEQGALGSALARRVEGLSIAEEIGDPELQASAHVSAGIRLADQGKMAEALRSYEKARELIESVEQPDLSLAIHIYSAMGRLREKVGYPKQALLFHREALAAAQLHHGELHRAVGVIYFDIGRASFLSGNYKDSLKNCTRSETIFSTGGAPSAAFEKRVKECIRDSEARLEDNHLRKKDFKVLKLTKPTEDPE